jgi:hypothetical protein
MPGSWFKNRSKGRQSYREDLTGGSTEGARAEFPKFMRLAQLGLGWNVAEIETGSLWLSRHPCRRELTPPKRLVS